MVLLLPPSDCYLHNEHALGKSDIVLSISLWLRSSTTVEQIQGMMMMWNGFIHTVLWLVILKHDKKNFHDTCHENHTISDHDSFQTWKNCSIMRVNQRSDFFKKSWGCSKQWNHDSRKCQSWVSSHALNNVLGSNPFVPQRKILLFLYVTLDALRINIKLKITLRIIQAEDIK